VATTGAIVEILVAGFLALIWLAMLLFSQADPVQIAQAASFFQRYKDYGALVLLGVLVLSYQLGWIVNACTYWLGKIYMVPLRRKVFGNDAERQAYDRLKAELYAWPGSEKIIKVLDSHTAVDRITRAGGLNFLMLAGVMLFSGYPRLPVLTMAAALLGIGCWIVAVDRHYRYYKYLRYAWDVCQASRKGEAKDKDQIRLTARVKRNV
jgi:hypothetical protein